MKFDLLNRTLYDAIFVFVLFVITITVPSSFAAAVVLEQITDVSIKQASITKVEKGIFSVAFTTTNNGQTPISDVTYGIRMQDKGGKVVYTQKYDEQVRLLPSSPKEAILDFSPPPSIGGEYDIFLLAKNNAGAILTLAFAGKLEIEKSSSIESFAKLVICSVSDGMTSKFICEVSKVGGVLGYRLFEGGTLGGQLMEGSIEVTQENIEVDLSKVALNSGRYGVIFELKDTNGAIMPTQQSATFVVPGIWMIIESFNQEPFTGNTFEASVYFNGVGENVDRGFKYWILDNDEAVCASGELDVQQQIPRKKVVKEDVRANCVNPTLAGFLYNGINTDGTSNVIDVLGEIPIDELLTKENVTNVGTFTNSLKGNSYFAFIAFSVLVIFALLYFVWTRKKSNVALLGAILLFGMFGSVTFTEAAVFLSADEDNVSFTVNLDQTQYSVTENITFSLGFSDTNTGLKPSGGAMSVKVDNGSFTEIISASDTATSYNVSLAPISSAGTYTLNFESPGLCGSAFGFSLFSTAKFGTDKCEFSVTVVVYANTAPTLPQIRGSCIAGANNQYEFSSTDGNSLFYEVDFGSDGSVDTRIPSSGTMSSAPAWGSAHYSGWLTQGDKSMRAQATDSNGLASGWKDYVISCTASCSAPVVCNGAMASTTMYAQPALIKPGDTSIIYWALENVLTCSIGGTNGDSWDWSIVGSQTQQSTSVINTDTTYTLSCTDLNGNAVSDSAKVRLVPNWQEF